MESSPIKFKKLIWDKPYLLGRMLGYDKLNEVHNQWIIDTWKSKEDSVLLGYRNSKKTTAILVVGVIWNLLFFPNDLIAIIRKSESGAIAVLKEIVKQYQSEKLRYIYKQYFGIDFELKDYNQQRLNIPTRERIAKENTIDVYGKGGSITGFHYDKILIDDIVTQRDRYSRAERESTKEYVKELKNVKTTSGKIICTDTPWHPDDLFSTSILPDAKRYPLGSIKDDDFTPEIISDLKLSLGGSLFACNYELKHIADENSLFPDMTFVKWDDSKTSSGWIDPAWGGICTTGSTFIQEQGDKLVVRGWVYPKHISDVKKELNNNASQCKCIDLMYESNGVDIKREQEIIQIYPIIRGVQSRDNKNYRIIFNIKQHLHRLYFADDCQTEYLEQLRNYIEGEVPNEAPDTLASLLREKYTFNSGKITLEGGKSDNVFKS